MSKTTPKLGVAYPLRIGKTLRNGPRSLLSLKFTHVPNNAQLAESGCLQRQNDKCTVSLPTADGKAVVFTGARTSSSAIGDYVLVFANGGMYLERADDVFAGMRPTLADAVPAPPPVPDDVRGDPDSWMVEESGSPITPEGNEGEEVRRPPGRMVSAGRVGGKTVAGKTIAGKSIANGHVSSSEEEGSDDGSDSDDSDSDSSNSNDYTDGSTDEDE